MSGPEFYDLFNDPREASGQLIPMFPAKSMFNMMKMRHMLWKEKYPDKGQNRDLPFTGIENPRPEVQEAQQPRIPEDDLPFDPKDVIERVPEWENIERWGIGE